MLVKVYDQQQYANLFFDRGQMHMKTVACFQRMEDDGSGRADPNEGLDRIFQKEGWTLSFKPEGEDHKHTPFVVIPSAHFTGPIKIFTDETRGCHAFCTYMVTTDHLELVRRGEPVLDERMGHLGGYAVLVNRIPEFLTKFKNATHQQGLRCTHGVVRYVDLEKHEGPLGPFVKDEPFAYQHEFRLMTSETGKASLNLEVGSLNGLAHRILGKDLNQVIAKALKEHVLAKLPA